MFNWKDVKKNDIKIVEKTTDMINQNLNKARDLDNFLKENADSMHHPSVAIFINDYMREHNIEMKEFVRRAKVAGFTRQYAYEFLDYKKKRKCSQDRLVAVALILGMTMDDANHLMKYAEVNTLYVKNKRDAILAYALNNKLSLADTNELLLMREEECLNLHRKERMDKDEPDFR